MGVFVRQPTAISGQEVFQTFRGFLDADAPTFLISAFSFYHPQLGLLVGVGWSWFTVYGYLSPSFPFSFFFFLFFFFKISILILS